MQYLQRHFFVPGTADKFYPEKYLFLGSQWGGHEIDEDSKEDGDAEIGSKISDCQVGNVDILLIFATKTSWSSVVKGIQK